MSATLPQPSRLAVHTGGGGASEKRVWKGVVEWQWNNALQFS